jgi:hypothetical protein
MTPDQVSAVRARVEQALGAAIRCPYCGIEGCACDHRWGESCRCLASQPLFKYAKELTDAIWPIMESALRSVPLSAETEGLRDKIADAWWAGRQSVRQWSVESASGPQLIAACDDLINKLLAAPTVAQAPQPKPEDR